jgi:hypothetical protein
VSYKRLVTEASTMRLPRVRFTVRRMMVVVAVLAVCLSLASAASYYISPPEFLIHAEGNRLVAGIESWRSIHGRYPSSLEEVGVRSLIRYGGGFRYERAGDGFRLVIGIRDGWHLNHAFESQGGRWYRYD